MVDIDLTTEEGLKEARTAIEKAIIDFRSSDKYFLTDLLFLMLTTISDQEVRIQGLEDEVTMLNYQKQQENGNGNK